MESTWQVQPTVSGSVVRVIEISMSGQLASHTCCLNGDERFKA